MPTVVFSPESRVTREKLQDLFAAENIDARVFFWPLSSLPMFGDLNQNRNSWSIPNRAINLPSYYNLSYTDQMRVCKIIKELVG
jgi:perosamine synthetase